MKAYRTFVALCLFLLPVSLCAQAAKVIAVSDQTSFDGLDKSIKSAASAGAGNIVVNIRPGTYFYNDLHISLVGVDYGGVSISIIGNGARLVAKGTGSESYDYRNGRLSASFEDVNPWSEACQADGLVTVLDAAKKTCRVQCKNLKNRPAAQCKDLFVRIPAWYHLYVCKVDRIENGYVYFTAPELQYVQKYLGYNINYDFYYGKKNPRLMFSDNSGDGVAYECTATTFFRALQSKLKSFSISGISFCGNAENKDKTLLQFYKDTLGSAVISNCSFEGIRSRILDVGYSDNVSFVSNIVRHNYLVGLYFDKYSANVRVVGNRFSDNGLAMNQSSCVYVSGKDYYVADNVFENFGYSAVRVGLNYIYGAEGSAKGVVEHNVIYYTPDYMAQLPSKTIMDGGAVYAMTCNTEAVIRYNYIHDYNGMHDNRAIFLDDGAANVKVYNNIVVNNPAVYSIDSRKCTEIETADRSFGDLTNVGNEIYGNIIDGSVRLVGRQGDNKCVKGANYVLCPQRGKRPDNNKFGSVTEADDVFIETAYSSSDVLYVPYGTYRQLRRMPGFQKISKYIKAR